MKVLGGEHTHASHDIMLTFRFKMSSFNFFYSYDLTSNKNSGRSSTMLNVWFLQRKNTLEKGIIYRHTGEKESIRVKGNP